MAAPIPRLKIDEFEVHLVYGFIADIIDGEGFGRWFEARLANAAQTGLRERSGWTLMYRLPGGADTVLQQELTHNNGDNQQSLPLPSTIERLTIFPPPNWELSSSRTITADLTFSYAIKRSGAGTLTICLKCPGESTTKYDTSHVLAMLLLAPRTEYGLPVETNSNSGVFDWQRELSTATLTEGGALDGVLRQPLDDRALSAHLTLPDVAASEAHFSPAFKLFLIGMTRLVDRVRLDVAPEQQSLLLAWKEFGEPERQATEIASQSEDEQRALKPRLYTGATHDPQVPYMYVVGTVPNNIYFKSFAERAEIGADYAATRRLRSRFTKDIAAILNRWLLDSNIPYVSYDQLEREGMTVDGAFLSHYMNSLLFTVFSGIVALTLRPSQGKQEAKSGLPFEPAKHSILHFIEFSRIRWHKGISINRDLDLLIDQARHANGREVQTALATLLDLRLKVAKYMQNPITYRWDATVGTAVAKYIHEQVIGELESATARKLALIKEVLMDRLDLIQSEAAFMQIEFTRSQIEHNEKRGE